ncbi:uncharacterized protein JCM15063_003775 [Sporobolomyces koalae]|uniref:uncharacterized protein n=1 Tax=Sporobolomyces koalae TaxID=500713 RepID=UPI003177C69F
MSTVARASSPILPHLMNASPGDKNLRVPGTTNSGSKAARHQLRQRSPQGQRGKSRRSSTTTTTHASVVSQKRSLRQLRNSRYWYPLVALVVSLVFGLIYSAIRISFHTAEYYPPISPSVVRERSSPSPSSSPRPVSLNHDHKHLVREPNPVRVGQGELDEAIRGALEDTWHLDSRSTTVGPTEDGERIPRTEPLESKKRSLAELYEELDELGISVDELNEVMQNAVGNEL